VQFWLTVILFTWSNLITCTELFVGLFLSQLKTSHSYKKKYYEGFCLYGHRTAALYLVPSVRFSALSKAVFCSSTPVLCGPGSSVCIATDCGLDGPGIESRWWRDSPHLSRPALGPTQPPVQWVPGVSRGKVRPGRAADHSPPSSAWSWKSRPIPLPTLWATPGL
jgi:hypothetical protein